MNTDLMFSSKTDLWATPQAFFDELDKEFGFTLDVCAIPENAKCSRFFSPTVNGLAQTWEGVCWCNPPYGREVGKWVKKAAEFAAGGYGCYAPSSKDRHGLVSRLYLWKSGNPVCSWSA